MKNVLLAFALIFFFIASAAKAQSYIEKAATEERLYKWDGQFLMKANTQERLFRWDGIYIMTANTSERLYKLDGQFLMTSNTGVRLLKIDGKIPTAIMIALATGLI